MLLSGKYFQKTLEQISKGKKLIAEKVGGASVEVQNERPANSKPQKEKMTKAERRALQDAQRAAKAAAKGACFSLVAWSDKSCTW